MRVAFSRAYKWVAVFPVEKATAYEPIQQEILADSGCNKRKLWNILSLKLKFGAKTGSPARFQQHTAIMSSRQVEYLVPRWVESYENQKKLP